MTRVSLLSGLDRVAWDQVTHAYGPAIDVPDLLRALVDPDQADPGITKHTPPHARSVRERVIWTLWGNVFHQGTVWEATPKVIPFLFEILRDGPDDLELRRFLVTYLHHLALGYPQDVFPAKIDPTTHYAVADAAPDPDDDDEYSESKMAGYARDCFLAVESGVSSILPFAHGRDEELALAAIACASAFPRRKVDSSDALGRLLHAESSTASEARIGAALVALAQLGDGEAQREAESRIAAPLSVLSLHAACASVIADGENASEKAVEALTAPIDDLTNAPCVFTGSLGVLVSRCLALLPRRHVEAAVVAVTARLATAPASANLAQTSTLLSMVFQTTPVPRLASELSPLQRAALEAIAKHGAFMIGTSSFGNYGLLLSEWGLPSDAEALTKWLAGSAIKGPSFGGFRSL